MAYLNGRKKSKNRSFKSFISPNIEQAYSLKTFLETMSSGQYGKQKKIVFYLFFFNVNPIINCNLFNNIN